tara:strand:+ start:448 stop:672 length:225 start_codon:yes stop_codon:yes gene_type:complete
VLFRFFKKLIKYYINKLVHWLRVKKLQFELDNEIKKYQDSFEKKEEPKIREVGKFGKDGWSISIGDIDDENTKN